MYPEGRSAQRKTGVIPEKMGEFGTIKEKGDDFWRAHLKN